MDQIFNLPAHPLFVHAPVVLMPLLTVLTAVLGVRPSWRVRTGWWLLAGAAVLLVGTLLATNSGESFDRALDAGDLAEKHQELAETTQLFVIGFFVAVAGMAVTSWLGRNKADSPGGVKNAAPMVLFAAAVLLGVLGTVWMTRTGHEGARIVWCQDPSSEICGGKSG